MIHNAIRAGLMTIWLLASITLVRAQPPTADPRPLDHTGAPRFGLVDVAPGFEPDPYRVSQVVGGGTINANDRNLGDECLGFIHVTPDFRITVREALPLLRVIFIADTILEDATLVIRAPDGRFLCNNNTANLPNPMVDARNAITGDYAVWVGGFAPGSDVFGALYVTSNDQVQPGSTQIIVPLATATLTPAPTSIPPTPTPALALDLSQPPGYGAAALEAGFLPDPFWAVLTAGGDRRVPAFDRGAINAENAPIPESTADPLAPASPAECGGYTSAAPSFRLDWGGDSTRLRLLFLPASPVDADAGLVIRAPDGEWHCNRNFLPGFMRPMVEFINPQAGAYQVWVTNEAAPDPVVGVLYVSEITTDPENIRGAASAFFPNVNGLDASAPAPGVQLGAYFTPDPYRIDAVAGGPVDVTALNPDINTPDPNRGCEGFYNGAPALRLTLAEPSPYLRVFFAPDEVGADATLIVRMPDGAWYCGDDSFETLAPTVNVIGNLSTGEALAWVGSYQADIVIPGGLYLTRGDADPTNPDQPPAQIGVEAQAVATLLPATATPGPTPTVAPPPPVLNLIAQPIYGALTLVDGFGAPQTFLAGGGGVIDASRVRRGCAGFIASEPTARIEWTGTGPLNIAYASDDDATLVIFAPTGEWLCSDDADGSINPRVSIPATRDGWYIVWVGAKESGRAVSGALTITQ